MPQQEQKGFTLVELLVAMAIIGVLIGLSLFGIAAAQRNARDTARRAAAQDINAGIADYFNITGAFPGDVRFDDDKVYVAPAATLASVTESTCTAVAKCVLIPLDGAAIVSDNQTGGNSGPLLIGETNTATTGWCYQVQVDGYSIGARLESGDAFQAGTSITDCEPPALP